MLKNTVILTALKIAGPMLSVALVLAISRILGAEGLGQYTLVLTVLSLFTTLTPFGLNAFIMREGSRDARALPLLLGNALVLGTASSLTLVPVMSALGLWLGYDETTRWALAIMSLAVLPSTLQVFFDAAFMAREKAEYVAASTIAELLVRVGGGSLLLLLGYGIIAVIATFVGGQILACLVSIALLPRAGVTLRWSIDGSVLRALAKAAPTFLSISIFATLYWKIDVLMVSAFRGIADVGLYGAAYRIMEIAKLLPQNICLALYPSLSYAATLEPTQLRRLGGIAFRYMWVITLPVAVGVSILAGPILSFVVGKEFLPATRTLQILIWTIIPYSWVRYYAYVLVAADRQRIDLRLNMAMSAVNILLNLFLIPPYGPYGAALATFFSICLFAICQYLYIQRYLPEHLAEVPALFQPLLASIVMAVLVWWGRELPVLFVLALAAATYFVVLLISRFFAADELRLLSFSRWRIDQG